jgi:hypothetical protein
MCPASRTSGVEALEDACVEFRDRVTTREHRVTRARPAVMLAEERAQLHPLPRCRTLSAFGQTREMSWQSTIPVGGARYSVPNELVDERVSMAAAGKRPTAADTARDLLKESSPVSM